MTASRLDFSRRVDAVDSAAHRCRRVETLMLNVGRRCDLSCSHCHHRCSPLATETMPRTVMEDALALADRMRPQVVDVTGGSPELWTLLPEFVERARDHGLPLRLRTNLMAFAREESADFAGLLASTGVTVLASLPGTSAPLVEAVRGRGVFERSIRALSKLATHGYGSASGPALEIAWNPNEGLPVPREHVEAELWALLEPLGIRVSRVRTISNVPLGNHGDHLRRSGEYEPYLHQLAEAFDARAVEGLACRDGLEVAWDGRLYDCDFNLAAGMPVRGCVDTVRAALADPDALLGREIAFGPHCFACTVGAGSG